MKKIFKYVSALALAGTLTLQANNVFAAAKGDTCEPGQTMHTAYFMFLNSASHNTLDNPDIEFPHYVATSANKRNVVGNVGESNIIAQWTVPITNGSESTSECLASSNNCKPWPVAEYWQHYYEMWKSITDNPTSEEGKDLVYRDGNDYYIGHIAWRRYNNKDFAGTPEELGDGEISKTDLIKYLESHASNLATSDIVTKGTNLPETIIHPIIGLGTSENPQLTDIRILRTYREKDKRAGFDLNGNNRVYSPSAYAIKYCTGEPSKEPEESTDPTPTKKKLTYDANGGTDAPNPVEFSASCVDIEKSEPTREGYTFIGWTENKNGTGDKYGKNGNAKYCGESATIYAQWEKNAADKKQIIYDKNTTDVVNNKPDNVTFGEECVENISDQWPSRDGYNFIAWNTEKDGSGDSFRPGAKLNKDYQCKNLTLYAQWEKQKFNDDGSYTVTYDANGGKTAPANQTEQKGACTKISEAKPTLSKSKFLGWSKDPKATEPDPKYAPGAEYCGDEGSVTLYAVWSPQTGVNAHLIAFGAAAVTAGAALIIAKKKDLFEQI